MAWRLPQVFSAGQRTHQSRMVQKKIERNITIASPQRAVDAVANALRTVGMRGKPIKSVVAAKDATDGNILPDYQAYVALAWLKALRVVDQRGRRAGYTLVPEKNIESTVTAAWPELPEWR